MIRLCTFIYTYEAMNMNSTFGGPSVTVNYWQLYHDMLEAGDDTLIWIITRKQYQDFMEKVTQYKLDKFLVQKHLCEGPWRYDEMRDLHLPASEQGVDNHNYDGDRRKLKIFVMKGAKA